MSSRHWRGDAISQERQLFLEGALSLFDRVLGDVPALKGEGYAALSASLRLSVTAYEQYLIESKEARTDLNSVLVELFHKVDI